MPRQKTISKVLSELTLWLLFVVIKLYQWVLSPILGANCRYLPTCSQYAEESLRNHGLIKGVYLSTRRLMRCHPWGGSGYDPVPENTLKKSQGCPHS